MATENIFEQKVDITKRNRSELKTQRPCVFWLTGLSGAGKSTIANAFDRKLHEMGKHTYLLDGDNVRHGLSKDLGFSEEDRVENLRRVAEVSKLMVDAGLIVISAFISPFKHERESARELFDQGEFIEVFIDTPLEIAEQRDVKGLYKMAREGKIKDFTGINSPYERPEAADVVIKSNECTADEAAISLIEFYTLTFGQNSSCSEQNYE